MSDTVILVEDISKAYHLGIIGTGTFANDLKIWWAKQHGQPNPLAKIGEVDHGNRDGETIWALKDINFSVERGEALGIIGKNGAGKSTLLKILSRITTPTSGEIKVKGCIASLLEVGTGFHPELTGRENIYLNGAILGMQRADIKKKFDEIVDFSGVEQFIDTPVKRYSSGMYVRLAFAVAAHLEPEILIVDEVLAVGDMEFQKKCLGKMNSVAQSGRTVLFVSHNMTAISGLCTRAILLDKGEILIQGEVESVLSKYYETGIKKQPEIKWAADEAPTNKIVRLDGIRVHNDAGTTNYMCDIRKSIGVELAYTALESGYWFTPSVIIKNQNNLVILNSFEQLEPDWEQGCKDAGQYLSTCWIPGNLLMEGTYTVRVIFWGFSRIKQKGIIVDDIVGFNVFDSIEGDSARGNYTGVMTGVIHPILQWDNQRLQK